MKNFFTDYIMYVLILVLVFVIVLAFYVYTDNRNQSGNAYFTWAIIQLGNGELIEGEVTSWHNFNDSDMIQVAIDDNLTVLTHSSNVLLFDHEPYEGESLLLFYVK